jgi:hypothetical protein
MLNVMRACFRKLLCIVGSWARMIEAGEADPGNFLQRDSEALAAIGSDMNVYVPLFRACAGLCQNLVCAVCFVGKDETSLGCKSTVKI